jgi:hypothetical protein
MKIKMSSIPHISTFKTLVFQSILSLRSGFSEISINVTVVAGLIGVELSALLKGAEVLFLFLQQLADQAKQPDGDVLSMLQPVFV